jgi:hypothetical protein
MTVGIDSLPTVFIHTTWLGPKGRGGTMTLNAILMLSSVSIVAIAGLIESLRSIEEQHYDASTLDDDYIENHLPKF